MWLARQHAKISAGTYQRYRWQRASAGAFLRIIAGEQFDLAQMLSSNPAQRKGESMRAAILVLLAIAPCALGAQERTVRTLIQGDTSRLPNFIQSARDAFSEQGLKLELVRQGERFDYNIICAQETSLAGAASACVALDMNGLFVASVVRSGRWRGKGALNLTKKELAKKIAVLQGSKADD